MTTPEGLIFNLECLLPGSGALWQRASGESDLDAARRILATPAEGGLNPAAGAAELLRVWSGIRALAVVTSLPLKAASELIKGAGWRGVFRVYVGGEHVRRPWPDAEWHRLAIERLKLPAERCLVFEATPGGVRAARNSGAPVCGIGHGTRRWGLAAAGAAWVARDFRPAGLDAILRGEAPRGLARWLRGPLL